MNILSFLRLRDTRYIHLLPRQCQGCWKCVDACPEDIIVRIDRTRRHHVHVRNAAACTGCKKCVRSCEYDAIAYIRRANTVAPADRILAAFPASNPERSRQVQK